MGAGVGQVPSSGDCSHGVPHSTKHLAVRDIDALEQAFDRHRRHLVDGNRSFADWHVPGAWPLGLLIENGSDDRPFSEALEPVV